MSETGLAAVIEPQSQLAALSPTPEQLIALAIERGVSIDTIERLMVMRERLHEQQAKAEFIAAMAAFQGECPVISKTKGVTTRSGAHAYSYAPLEVVVEQVKPLLAKHGFSYRHEMQPRDKGVLVLCHVTHIGGHTETTPMDVPFGQQTQVMSDSQVVAAATTFAKRYAFLNAFGIMTADEDTDGQDVHRDDPPPAPLRRYRIEVRAAIDKGDKQHWATPSGVFITATVLAAAYPATASTPFTAEVDAVDTGYTAPISGQKLPVYEVRAVITATPITPPQTGSRAGSTPAPARGEQEAGHANAGVKPSSL